MRTALVAGNWKMHKTLPDARALVTAIREGMEKEKLSSETVEVLICPPVHLLFPMAKAVAGTRIMLGAQNAHEQPSGAFTGEVSVPMIAETGCTHIIIGHSERRHIFGESGPVLARKVRAVTSAGLWAIYCVGETLADREANRTKSVIEQQMLEVLSATSSPEKTAVSPEKIIIAYEPVWAIGTGKTATPEQAQEVHAFIRSKLVGIYGEAAARRTRILYGGSVKPDNAETLANQPDIDGMLVGGASLEAGQFLAIVRGTLTAKTKLGVR